jgi:hypothetical protein
MILAQKLKLMSTLKDRVTNEEDQYLPKKYDKLLAEISSKDDALNYIR